MYKIGIDEAGRGPWMGPVVACSLTFDSKNLPNKDFLNTLDDSKKLTSKKREEIFKELVRLSNIENPQVYFGVGVVDNYLIDQINIKQANKEAMRRSLVELLRKIDKDKINGVLIDGNDNYEFKELKKNPIYIISGDEKVLEIKASSIIAKVFRDKLIETYAILYPNLNLKNHKGYGTQKHIEYLTDKSKITGIHRLSYKPIKKILETKPKLLLHICCGPDSSIPIIDLKNDYELICFWYNPNIQPKTEYDKRLKAFKKVCEIEKISFIEGDYDVKNFLTNIKGFKKDKEGGTRCKKCIDMRLLQTSLKAKELGIKYWTTTLLISPRKNTKTIYDIGNNWSLKNNLEFLQIDFKKNNGFGRSVEYCKKNDIYRQNYCGCIYSLNLKNYEKNILG